MKYSQSLPVRMMPVGFSNRPAMDEMRAETIRRTKAETRRRLVLAGFSPYTAKKLSDIATMDEIKEVLREMERKEDRP